jgi:Flp pilus assembly protein TadD/SAM-dependent methyltransferase
MRTKGRFEVNRKERRAGQAAGRTGNSPKPVGQVSFVDELRTLGDREAQAGRLTKAEGFYRQALVREPDDATTLHRLGDALLAQERAGEAAASYQRALKVHPDNANALINLGEALYSLGRRDEAIASWQQAQAASPRHPLPAMNLGIAHIQQGKYQEAVVQFRRATELDPNSVEARTNLARAYVVGGDALAALKTIWGALALRETQDAKAVFAECLRRFRFTADMPEIRGAVARAITEAWARPDDISAAAIDLVRKSPALAACMARVAGEELWPPEQRRAIERDPLLRALMQSAPICDFDLERFLTSARGELLRQALASAHSVDPATLEFCCALARQCFINEYVYALDADEAAEAGRLREAVEKAIGSGADVPALSLALLAAYYPMHALAGANSLPTRLWPDAVKDLVLQQIVEPLEEARLRQAIPALTAIDDAVSLAVKEQYEQNPYPRWARTPAASASQTVGQTLGFLYPQLAGRLIDRVDGCDVLVAGCGTGQQSIEVAQRYRGARVLAVDLSLASLSYAKRKTREFDIKNIDYAQADILKLGGIGRTFDVIESVGVLHHLDDPFAGWRVLISLLRPGGFMHLGLYSAIARRPIVTARAMIGERGYGNTPDYIRRFRQELAAEAGENDIKRLLRSPDFYSLSGCRDLCFHVQEHQLMLPQIKAFLAANDLEFLGFVLEADTVQRFLQSFPGASADLDCWHEFEQDNPNLFSNLYYFWVRKAG